MTIDLHNHTYYSDGLYSPTQVIDNAVRDGISAIALTDHDTMQGVQEAQKRAKELNIDFVPGIELTVKTSNDEDNAAEIHILGLFVKPSKDLDVICNNVNNAKDIFSYKLADMLRKYKGINIDIDRDLRKEFKGAISTGALGVYLLHHGYVNSFEEFMDMKKELVTGDLLKEKKEIGICAADAIDAIHKADGLAFLAHPYRMRIDENLMIQRIKEYKKLGLNGLECHYKRYGDGEAKKIERSLEIAAILGLLISGGSDYHQDSKKGRFASGVGVPDEVLEKLYQEKGLKRISYHHDEILHNPYELIR